MQIFRGLSNFTSSILPCSLTIGNFDGIHKGHRQIIQNTIDRAKQKGLKSAILTFCEHPIKLFKPESYDHYLIHSLSQKLKFLQKFELDYLFILPFNNKIANITAENFVKEILIDKIKMQDLVVGYDFIFGKNREGSFEFLSDLSKKANFTIDRVSVIKGEKETFSSSLTRDLIRKGRVAEANKILDKEFEVEGIVRQGLKNGHKIGFPTLNITVKPAQIMPKYGVYESEVFICSLNKNFKSITNFGVRPTINDGKTPLYETHILNYGGGDLYGEKITLKLKKFIRDERKFDSLEDLKRQISLDIVTSEDLNRGCGNPAKLNFKL